MPAMFKAEALGQSIGLPPRVAAIAAGPRRGCRCRSRSSPWGNRASRLDRGGQGAEQSIIVARGGGEQPAVDVVAPRRDVGLRQAAGVERRWSAEQPLASAIRRRRSAGRRKRPSSRWPWGAIARPASKLRDRPAIDVDQRSRRRVGRRELGAARRPNRRAFRPAIIDRRPGRPRGAGRGAGAADHGHAEHARRAGRNRDRVAADQRQAVAFARRFNSAEECHPPIRRRRKWSATATRRAGFGALGARSDRFTATSFQPTLAGGSDGR